MPDTTPDTANLNKDDLDKAIRDAITAYINAQHPDLPPLSWWPPVAGADYIFGVVLGGLDVAAQWADRLGLARETDATERDPDVTSYSGHLDRIGNVIVSHSAQNAARYAASMARLKELTRA